jgi:hypothetical protein
LHNIKSLMPWWIVLLLIARAFFDSITPTPRCSGQPSMIPKGTPIR